MRIQLCTVLINSKNEVKVLVSVGHSLYSVTMCLSGIPAIQECCRPSSVMRIYYTMVLCSFNILLSPHRGHILDLIVPGDRITFKKKIKISTSCIRYHYHISKCILEDSPSPHSYKSLLFQVHPLQLPRGVYLFIFFIFHVSCLMYPFDHLPFFLVTKYCPLLTSFLNVYPLPNLAPVCVFESTVSQKLHLQENMRVCLSDNGSPHLLLLSSDSSISFKVYDFIIFIAQ